MPEKLCFLPSSTQLNSTSTQTKAEVCLISTFPSHSPMTVVSIEVKLKTSFRPNLEQDFKYFNWRVQILAKPSLNSNQIQFTLSLNSISIQLKLLSLALLSSSLFIILLKFYHFVRILSKCLNNFVPLFHGWLIPICKTLNMLF